MAEWEGYLREARRFFEIAEAADDPEHLNQAASNAVHAAIAACDGVVLYLGGTPASGRSHADAAQALVTACGGTAWESEAPERARQLRDVLRVKTAAQYQGRPLPAAESARVLKQARRFLEWAERVVR